MSFKSITEGCLILKIKNLLCKKCRILADPMGIKDAKEINWKVPVVLKVSEDHFKKNTAFADGRYRVLEEQRRAYKDAPLVQFEDIVGLVYCCFQKNLFVAST